MIRPRAFAAFALVPALLAGGCAHGRHKHVAAAMAPSKVTAIGVNAYLWRASLDTLSFMPLVQTDSNGGVIVTDWYINPQAPTERVKVTVLRQVQENGQWVAAPVQAATVQKLEDIILTKARDLRRAAIAS